MSSRVSSDELSVSTVRLEVPSLGSITGLCFNDSVCQYLGIPYADIPGRFRRSVPVAEPWPEKTWDGTKLGPYCPQPPRVTYPITAPERSWVEEPGMDEFDCLNLNISVPRLPSCELKELLPVMVHFHGGAFTWSTGSAAIYDGRTLATISRNDLDRPTIVITLNYRLGAYGFLAGRDIEAYNKSHGESGVGNYGIWDQILALRWVQSHIREFGGDPDRVTVFGQSAGGVSIHTHLLRDERLFSSAIMQSGTVTLCGIMEIDEYQVVYEKFLRDLGISTSLSPEERLSRLLQVDAERLVPAAAHVLQVPCQTWRLCDDHVLLPGRSLPRYHNYDQFSVPDWCREIMIGDCTHEAIIWGEPYLNMTAGQLLQKMNSFFGPEKASFIADTYGISSDMPQQDVFRVFEKMTSDGMYVMLDYFAAIAHPRMYAYHFDVPQPWKGKKWCGIAHHSFDNVLVWGILKNTLPPAQQKISEKMSEAWLRFANGESPWERFGDNQRWMVIEESGMTMKDRQEDERRGYWRFDRLHKEGLVGDLGHFSDNTCLVTSELLSLDTA